DGVLALRADPGVGHHLLEAETEFSGLLVDADDFDINDIADFDELGRLDPTAMGDLADVEQAVEPAEIDERAVVHDIADRATADLTFGDFAHQFRLLLFLLTLQ